MTADEIAEQLGGRASSDGSWSARCPGPVHANGDRNPSLSISAGEQGGVLLHCHAGCSTADVVAAAGLTMLDLAPPRTESADTGPIAVYHYTDEHGAPLFDVKRWAGKNFSQHPANGPTGKGAMKGVRLVLYRLPAVVKAVQEGATVFVVEGEKDADNLAAAGWCATTTPMGAGKWPKVSDHARQVLSGADVVVIADRDEAGYRHAAAVVAGLCDVAASVHLKEPAEGKDVTDHLNAGRGVHDLVEVEPVASTVEKPPASLLLPASWSDAHVGEAFGATIAGRWLFCRQLGGWLQWDGRRWQLDPGEAVFEEFRQWVIAVGSQVWQSSGDSDTMKQVARYRERGKIDAAVTIARRLDAVAATASEFDQHPHLLNVHNGVVDLRDGTLQPHDPALRFTKLAGAEYHPNAQHADVDTMLEALDPDPRAWVQRLCGAAAFGSVVDDVMAVFDGKGANGKTTLLNAVASSLGDYACPASTRLLMARGVSDEHPTLLADLFGRRLVYIEETPEGGALRMEQVKSITGGGALKARFIGKDYFEFAPSHQLIVATNHRPAVNASDYAAWRRLRLVPFTRTYRLPHEARPGDLAADRGLRPRLGLPAQRQAVLAWIVAGAVAWSAEGGLGPCAAIDEATSAWRRDEDVIHAWWNDRLTSGRGTPAAELYRSFVSWCEQEGRRYVSSNKEFAKKFVDHDLYRDHGISKRSTAMGAWYDGVEVLVVVDVVGSTPGSHEGSSRELTPLPTTSTTTSDDSGLW